jgi:hypothetical protein
MPSESTASSYQERYDLFVSYCRKDSARLTPLVDALVGAGLDVFLDICQWSQNKTFSGDELRSYIHWAVSHADAGRVCLSSAARDSSWFALEMSELLSRKAVSPEFHLLGLRLDGGEPRTHESLISWLPHPHPPLEVLVSTITSILPKPVRSGVGTGRIHCRHCWRPILWNASYCPLCRKGVFPRCPKCGGRGTCDHRDGGGGEVYLEEFDYACMDAKCGYVDEKIWKAGDAVEGWQPNECPYCSE